MVSEDPRDEKTLDSSRQRIPPGEEEADEAACRPIQPLFMQNH